MAWIVSDFELRISNFSIWKPTGVTPQNLRWERIGSENTGRRGGCRAVILQTLYAYFLKRETHLCLRRERWETPDNDFIDLDWLDSSDGSANLLVLFHGLEGCSSSHYAQSLMNYAGRRSWRGVISHFRGCSGEHNRLVRAYHSGDSSEIDWILRRLKENNPRAKIYAVGVSLGGNVLLKWLGEQGERALEIIEKAAAVSAPIDLAAAAGVLDRGCRKLIYTRYFLRTLKQKSLYKIAKHQLTNRSAPGARGINISSA